MVQKTVSLLMRLEYKVVIPDQDFAVSSQHKLVSSGNNDTDITP